MIPIIYPATESAFTSRGYGPLSDCGSCIVTEVLNGEYTLSLRYPKNGINQEHLQVRNIIVCLVNSTTARDAFRISKVNRSMKDYIAVTAYHLSYDLTGYPVLPPDEPITGVVNSSSLNLRESAPDGTIIWAMSQGTKFEFISAETYNGVDWYNIKVLSNGYTGWCQGSYTTLSGTIGLEGALDLLNDACDGDFTITTDKSSSASFNVDVPSSVRSWFGGKEGSLIDIYGGEWLYNLWTCQLLEHRGVDNGVRLSYGTNLSKYVKEITDGIYSEIIPYFSRQSNDDSVVVVGGSVSTGVTAVQRAFYLNVSDKFGDNYGKVFKINPRLRVWKGSAESPWIEASEDAWFVVTANLNRILDYANVSNFTILSDDSFSFLTPPDGYSNPPQGVAFPVKVDPSTRYEFSCVTNSYGRCVTVSFANAGGSKLSSVQLAPTDGVISGEFVTPNNAVWAVLVFLPTTWTQTCTWSNIKMASKPAVADVTAFGNQYLQSHDLTSDTMTISAEAETPAINVNMGDTVHIIYDDAIVDSRIVKTVWNAITERYTTLEIGTVKQNIAQTIKSLR